VSARMLLGQGATHRTKETAASFGLTEPPRFVNMPVEEETCKTESLVQRGHLRPQGRTATQECRQGQQLVVPGCPGLPRDRPAALRRDINEIVAPASGRAFVEIEPEAQFVKQKQLEADDELGGRP